jgi:hypothetical protein
LRADLLEPSGSSSARGQHLQLFRESLLHGRLKLKTSVDVSAIEEQPSNSITDFIEFPTIEHISGRHQRVLDRLNALTHDSWGCAGRYRPEVTHLAEGLRHARITEPSNERRMSENPIHLTLHYAIDALACLGLTFTDRYGRCESLRSEPIRAWTDSLEQT